MNWRRIAVTGLVVGMVAVTGCSSNIPENNHGNRNGERVSSAINRHNYTTTRATTRNTHGRYNTTYRTGVDGVSRPKRSLNLGRPHGRIGNAFRYNHNRGYANGVNHNIHNYDMGVTAAEQAVVNNRVTRSTVTPAIPHNDTIVTPQKPATKRVDTKRTTTRSTTPKAATKTHTPAPKPAPPLTTTAPPLLGRPATHGRKTAPRLAQNRSTVTRNTNKRVPLTQKRATRNANYRNARNIGLATNMEQTVAVMNSDDMVFFRKKVEEPQTMPEQAQPEQSSMAFDDSVYDDSVYDDNYENTNVNDSDNANDSTVPSTEPDYGVPIPHNIPHSGYLIPQGRLMK